MVHVVDEEHWPGGLTGLAAPPPDPAPLTPVCLHGTMGGAWQFEQAQRRWAERGLASVALNYRGHHDSRPVCRLGRVSVQAYIDDATSVTESTNGPMLVGQSMGGAIALAVAAPNRHRRRRAGVCLPPRPVRWRGAHRVRSSASHRSNTYRPTVCNPRISGHDRRRGHRDPRTVDGYGEAWNAHDLDVIMSFHAEDGTHCLHVDREREHGTDEIREAFGSYLTEWPDMHFERRRMLVGDGLFVHEMLVTPTADGKVGRVPDGGRDHGPRRRDGRQGHVLRRDHGSAAGGIVSAADAATTSVADFERLWQTKDLEIVREIVAPEAIASWSGLDAFRGADYPDRMRNVMRDLLADIVLEATAHAVNGDDVFISWPANASVGGEAVEWVGIDRFRLKGDLADEVYAVFDTFRLREAQDRGLGQVAG
jgi:pimeloyl-ACP methyl ester carboxylesterase